MAGVRSARILQYGRRAAELVWTTSPALTIVVALVTIVSGVAPAVIAYVGALIVDGVVAAARAAASAGVAPRMHVMELVALEGLLVALSAIAQRGSGMCQSLLRDRLGHRVNVMILEKALTLELRHFENSELYDKLLRAQREATSRPLSFVTNVIGLLREGISLASYAALLIGFSPWAMAVLLLAGVPTFIAEARYSQAAFKLFRRRSPDLRMQSYLETVISRDDHVQEVKLFGLGPMLLDRYRANFRQYHDEQRQLTLRHQSASLALSLIGTAAYYGAYAWIAFSTIVGRTTLGQMTMYLSLFRSGQGAVGTALASVNRLYDDTLYLSTLYEFLETPSRSRAAGGLQCGPHPRDGIRFEQVSYHYPGIARPALSDVTLHVRPGESLALVGENGSGKTTLIKLLTRLYTPTAGRILLDGLDLEAWDEDALRRRVGVIFQDFTRYQFTVGENVGAGDVRYYEDESRWRAAADKGLATPFVVAMPGGFRTRLGKWFDEGRELSGGQWQKIALSRAFMRTDADIVVLDEPTAAMDAAAEAEIFEHFRALMKQRIAILISHRFSTVRMASQIVVLEKGRVIERGTHDELMRDAGAYSRLFLLQAKGYR
ncbi:MAG: ABC transporter ATP-binding protein [Gammaproteobacteria bacterium]